MRVSDSNSGLKMSKCCQRNLRSKCYSARNDRNPSPTQKEGKGQGCSQPGDGAGNADGGQRGRLFGHRSLWLCELRTQRLDPHRSQDGNVGHGLLSLLGTGVTAPSSPSPSLLRPGWPDPSQLLGTSSPFVMGEAK